MTVSLVVRNAETEIPNAELKETLEATPRPSRR